MITRTKLRLRQLVTFFFLSQFNFSFAFFSLEKKKQLNHDTKVVRF